MKSIYELHEELNTIRKHNRDVFGVEYYSVSNPSNRHYVVMRSDAELNDLKKFHREYDFKFNKLAI